MAKEIAAEAFTESPFKVIGKEWMLVAAEADGKANAMTVSWGGMGVLWGKNVAFIFIRPTRYTKEFIDRADKLTLSVFTEEHRKMMRYFGTVSGRDEDKLAKSGLTVRHENGYTTFAEARVTMECRKLYAQALQSDCFLDKSCDEKWYDDDYHTMYVVGIEKIRVEG
ncbi:flavin reductase [uncultured Mitsuokella sp.]|uniref:flavin reductase family protein n=1 Tax=uncultured Mitsuokella sp. TaxID=453120 RepID=UPI0026069B69|nr:flavin reductase [uncultured Mitsuokella sp.]